jgi:hypothetical protein
MTATVQGVAAASTAARSADAQTPWALLGPSACSDDTKIKWIGPTLVEYQ